ncbi:MAG: hypothetical protein K2N72_02560 [Oscillospiraceae bacterium]|nr:hypothetical protein [Oscillospiraceae bacterium]
MEKLHSKKFIGGFLLAGFLISVIFACILIRDENAVRTITPGETASLEGMEIISKIESIELPEEKGGRMRITGYLFKRGESIRTVAVQIIMRDTGTGSCLSLPTAVITNMDVLETYAEDGCDYNNAGFEAFADCRGRFDPYNKSYDLFALYTLNGTEYFVPLGGTVGNGGGNNE